MEAQESELTRQTILQVTELYNLRHQVKPEDRKLFFPSLESHLERPQHELRAWLSNHKEQIQTSHSAAVSGNTTHTRPLTFILRNCIYLN